MQGLYERLGAAQLGCRGAARQAGDQEGQWGGCAGSDRIRPRPMEVVQAMRYGAHLPSVTTRRWQDQRAAAW